MVVCQIDGIITCKWAISDWYTWCDGKKNLFPHSWTMLWQETLRIRRWYFGESEWRFAWFALCGRAVSQARHCASFQRWIRCPSWCPKLTQISSPSRELDQIHGHCGREKLSRRRIIHDRPKTWFSRSMGVIRRLLPWIRRPKARPLGWSRKPLPVAMPGGTSLMRT